MLINNGHEQFLILFEYACTCNKCAFKCKFAHLDK